MVKQKVLVATIVFEGHEQFLDSFLAALNSQDFEDKELLFVDCVGKPDVRKRLEKAGSVLDSVMRVKTREALMDCRQRVFESFDNTRYTHLLFLDPDIILQKNALSRLLFHGKDIISGIYLSNMKLGNRYEICPCIYSFEGDDSVRVFELSEVLDSRLVEIACAGLGCTLLSGAVVRVLGEGAFDKGGLSDDIAFFMNAREAGLGSFADTSVKCNRLVKQGDERMNDLFSFDSYPKIREPRVLIGCVTYDKDDQYIESFLDCIRAQDYRNYDIVFAETSGNREFIARLKGSGSIVLECFNEQDHPIKKITDGRNAIREFFLSNEYDYVWFVDSDVRPPSSALSQLLSHRKDVVTGIYLGWVNVNGTNRVMPIVYSFDDEEGYCRPMWLADVLDKGILEVSCAGFGCTLATRSVLEQVSVRFYSKSMAGEDIAFYVDARKAGFRTFADTSIKCPHLVLPVGDPRNRKFRFETYEKGDSYTFSIDNIAKD